MKLSGALAGVGFGENNTSVLGVEERREEWKCKCQPLGGGFPGFSGSPGNKSEVGDLSRPYSRSGSEVPSQCWEGVKKDTGHGEHPAWLAVCPVQPRLSLAEPDMGYPERKQEAQSTGAWCCVLIGFQTSVHVC